MSGAPDFVKERTGNMMPLQLPIEAVIPENIASQPSQEAVLPLREGLSWNLL